MAFVGPLDSFNSKPIQTKVGTNQTNIFTATSTKVVKDSSGKVTGGETTLYYSPNAGAYVPAATTKDGGKSWSYLKDSNGKEILGTDAKASLEKGPLKNNTQKQIVSATTKSTGGLSKEDQKIVASSTQNNATSAGIATASAASVAEDLKKEQGGTRNNFSLTLKYPENLQAEFQDVIKFSMVKYSPKKFNTGDSKTLSPFENRIAVGGKGRDIIGVVTLPIPGGIGDGNLVDWGSDSVNVAEANFAGIADAAIGAGGGAGADAANNKINAVANNADAVKEAVKAHFVSAATGLQNPLSRTQGAVLNPNMELLFNGPQLRPFSFTFRLSPRSEKESKSVRSIIRFFKQGMSPIRTQSNLFLKAPHTFQIQYLHKKEEHKFINKIKECALTSFIVNYTPESNYATFTDGAMVSYEIQMQFTELEPIFNDDYGNAENKDDTEIGY
jgi:hypothetical protein